jgi:hypothetical protein
LEPQSYRDNNQLPNLQTAYHFAHQDQSQKSRRHLAIAGPSDSAVFNVHLIYVFKKFPFWFVHTLISDFMQHSSFAEKRRYTATRGTLTHVL